MGQKNLLHNQIGLHVNNDNYLIVTGTKMLQNPSDVHTKP